MLKMIRRGFVFLGAAGVGKGTFADIICSSKGWDHISTGYAVSSYAKVNFFSFLYLLFCYFYRDLLRVEIQKNSDIGKSLKTTINEGRLVSDVITNELVLRALSNNDKSFVLDGYPRSIEQAKFLYNFMQDSNFPRLKVIHITLREDIIIKKLLGRRICRTCGGNFNIENVVSDGFEMPAILVTEDKCKRGKTNITCNPVLLPRDDDTKNAIEKRLLDYRQKIGPILQFYNSLGVLHEFEVKKGVKDSDALLNLMIK